MAVDGGADGADVVAVALLDKLPHHATVVQIRELDHGVRQYANFVPEPKRRPRAARHRQTRPGDAGG